MVFGPGDSFLTLFARLQKLLPVMPLARADARLQPVYVGDVAQAVVNVLDAPAARHRTLALAGPRAYTLRQLVELAGQWSGHRRPVIALPAALGRLQARLMELAPGEPLMSRDNLDSMTIDNVSAHSPDPVLGIVPAALETVGPLYLGPDPSRYGEWRTRAHR